MRLGQRLALLGGHDGGEVVLVARSSGRTTCAGSPRAPWRSSRARPARRASAASIARRVSAAPIFGTVPTMSPVAGVPTSIVARRCRRRPRRRRYSTARGTGSDRTDGRACPSARWPCSQLPLVLPDCRRRGDPPPALQGRDSGTPDDRGSQDAPQTAPRRPRPSRWSQAPADGSRETYSTVTRLREVARLVDVRALQHRGVVGEQLDRDRVEDRRDEADRPSGSSMTRARSARRAARSPPRRYSRITLPPRATTSCMLRRGLLEQLVARRDHDHRHVLVDQRDRPVLQLARGIALGVDVGDLLELQRAFEGDRDSWCRGRDRARRGPWPARARSRSICVICSSTSAARRGTSSSACVSSRLALGVDARRAPAPRRRRGRQARQAGS